MEGETESLPCCGDIPTPNVSLSSTEIVLLQLSKIWGGFYPVHRAHHGGFPCLGTSSKKNPNPNKKTHTINTHTKQNCAPLFCVSVTQIAAIISLALQAFSFILKAVFGITLHLTQFNK